MTTRRNLFQLLAGAAVVPDILRAVPWTQRVVPAHLDDSGTGHADYTRRVSHLDDADYWSGFEWPGDSA